MNNPVKNIGIIEYRKTLNIGDYVQTIAAKNLIEKKGFNPVLLERETLNNYTGKPINTIINGWFLHDSNAWPPSAKIKPFFISFHITKKASRALLSKKSVAFFKKHEPIGCRDFYTKTILEEKGIKTYFSSCLTLTLEKKDFIDSSYESDIIWNDVILLNNKTVMDLTSLKPISSQGKSNAMYKLFNEWRALPLKYSYFKKYLKNINAKKYLLKNFSKKEKENMINLTNAVKGDILAKYKMELVKQHLKYLANTKLVVTSRIHTALPCLAFGTPVLFIDTDELPERLNGIKELLNCIYYKDIKNKKPIDLKKLTNKPLSRKYANSIQSNVYKYLGNL